MQTAFIDGFLKQVKSCQAISTFSSNSLWKSIFPSTNNQNIYDLHVSYDAFNTVHYLLFCRSMGCIDCGSIGKRAHGCPWISVSKTCSSFPPNGKILPTVTIRNYLQYPPAFTLPCCESPGQKTDGVEGIQSDSPSVYLRGPHGLSETWPLKIRTTKHPESFHSQFLGGQPRSGGKAKWKAEFSQPFLTQAQGPASAEVFTDGCTEHLGFEGEGFGKILAWKSPWSMKYE